MNVIIYDIEILRAIQSRGESRLEGIDYCAGWQDHANMGISVVGVYDYAEDRYRAFCADNRRELLNLIGERRPLCVGFNNIRFDNAVMRVSEGWDAPADAECYDLLRETWVASGLGPEFNFKTHGGFGLDAMCEKNFGTKKTGNGALAPVLWQRGQIGEVIDYCLNDVRLTKQLFDAVLRGDYIKHPKGGPDLTLRFPDGVQ